MEIKASLSPRLDALRPKALQPIIAELDKFTLDSDEKRAVTTSELKVVKTVKDPPHSAL